MLSEPALYFLRDVIMDPNRDDDTKMKAVKLTLDRVVPASLNIDASLTHKVAGWERVLEKAFAEPQAIERGPSDEDPLQDLTDAYNDRGYTFQEDRRKHAVRILGREVQTSHELSSGDIQKLLRDLRPDQTYGEVIEAEVVKAREPDNRIEPSGEALPSGLVEMGRRMENTKARTQDNYGTARSYGRYNPPTEHR